MDPKKAIRLALLCLSSFVAVVVAAPSIIWKNSASVPLPPVISAIPTGATDPSLSSVYRQGLPSLYIPVYLTKEKKVESLPLETYVRGVLAAEMPIEFELEALKAQAMAARTYIIRKQVEQEMGMGNLPPGEALVTDTINHQVYVSDLELKARWGSLYEGNSDKLDQAIRETEGIVLTYDGKPIEANFFSTSNGYTENSEDYWNTYIPYLRSVPSPWDRTLSPRFKETIELSAAALRNKLGISSTLSVSAGNGSGLQIIELSQGHRIKKLRIAGKAFSGREVREKLGLNSSQFQWSWQGDRLQITTFGYGHGVGMSQWGAQGMALEGRKAEEIVKYFYTGIELGEAANFSIGNNLQKK
ncbi:stage II sporulation protein D [Paenibacillus sp. FSL H8-0034]|uniref:stage II sporulation protein D n=1 Tax=Paenibacillus sp. FSL H8-0034 TaxID=2954671 RepID=UPI0030F78F1C